MHIDTKVTIWTRLHVHESDNEQEILKRIKEGATINDLFNEFDSLDYEVLYDTEEQITVEENQGNATVEVFASKYDKEPIFSNT